MNTAEYSSEEEKALELYDAFKVADQAAEDGNEVYAEKLDFLDSMGELPVKDTFVHRPDPESKGTVITVLESTPEEQAVSDHAAKLENQMWDYGNPEAMKSALFKRTLEIRARLNAATGRQVEILERDLQHAEDTRGLYE